MTTFNELTTQDTVVSSDQVPIYSTTNGQPRKASAAALAAFVGANLPTATVAGAASVDGALTVVGDSTMAKLSTTHLVAFFTDSTATPGNVTNNSARGRVAFGAGASTIVVTSSKVTAASMIIVTLRTPDTALTNILRVLPTAGSFTITANAASTGTAAQADFLVVN